MSGRIFLHVGLPKSGTSYLQRLLIANRDRLRADGVLFPGSEWSDQVLAVRDVRGLHDQRGRARVEGRWDRLAAEMLAWRGDSVISMEWLCAAGDEQIERILGSFPGRRCEVVFTARDLARTLPAAWQEFMQNRQSWSWDEFLDGVREPETTNTGGKAFWAQQHLPRLLERWSGQMPASQIHVVTLPQPGADRDLLWRRFAGVLGIEPEGYTTEGLVGNESLGLESAELMRRVNAHLALSPRGTRGYNPNFKHRLAKEVLAARRSEESTLALPPAVHEWACEVAEEHIAAVRGSGAVVVGDLEELRPSRARDGRQPGDISDAELLDTAVAALVGLARAAGKSQRARPAPRPRPGVAPHSRRARIRARLRRLLRRH